MMIKPVRSLQLRLVLRVAVLFIPATVVVIGVLMARAFDTARSLGDRELITRATELAKFVSINPNGSTRLDLPLRLATVYEASSADDIFAIRDLGGRVVAASPTRFGEIVAAWPHPA